MKKTMIYLTEEQHSFLRDHSARTGTSMAELIRDAVADFMARAGPERPELFDFVGSVGGSGGGDTAARDEDYLREIFLDSPG